MSSLPLHAAVVHVPLGLATVMPFLAAGVAWAIWRGRLPRSALALVAGLQLVIAGAGFVAMSLGDQEAQRAGQVAFRADIHAHEEAAETFVWASVVVLAVAAAGLFLPARLAPALAGLTAVGAAVALGLAVNAGEKGGALVFRHAAGVEASARPGAAAPAAAPASAPDRDED